MEPAADEMEAFVEFCEVEFARLGSDPKVTRNALDLFDKAKSTAPPDSVYGRRIALVDEYLPTLRSRGSQIAVKRPEGLPEYRVIDMAKDNWRDARDTLEMDGKLDEPFWTAYNYPRGLRDLRTGKKPTLQTHFLVRWWNDSLYFGIRCELAEGESPIVGSTQDNDPAIWQGEYLELLIETDKHSHYQIVVNPAGAIIDLDRAVALSKAYDWSSQAEVATHIGDGYRLTSAHQIEWMACARCTGLLGTHPHSQRDNHANTNNPTTARCPGIGFCGNGPGPGIRQGRCGFHGRISGLEPRGGDRVGRPPVRQPPQRRQSGSAC